MNIEVEREGGECVNEGGPLYKWDNSQLYYSLLNGHPNLTLDSIKFALTQLLRNKIFRLALRDAFTTWSQLVPLTFAEVGANEPADIKISFQSGDHGDGFPFYGRGDDIAHAFLLRGGPQDGIIHFDADETWSTEPLHFTQQFVLF